MDARFSSAQLDPRFQRIPKREAKVPIDSRFSLMLSNRSFTSSATPMDKRGKPKKRKDVNPLLHYYLYEKDLGRMKRWKEGRWMRRLEKKFLLLQMGVLMRVVLPRMMRMMTMTTDICRYLMSNHEDTPTVDQETHRLAIVNMDWDHIKSVDLYIVMSSCLPKSGQILSVTVYPSEFGLKCMEIEAVRWPTSLICDDEKQSEEELDSEVINEKLRAYEMNKVLLCCRSI